MRKAARPHDLGAMQVVVRLLQYFERAVLYGADEAFGNGVGYGHVIIVGEVAFQRVHDDIYYAGCRLIGRQCKGALRVHYGKLAAELIAAVVFFQVAVFVGNDCGIAHFATCCREGEHGSQGEASVHFGFMGEEIPNVSFVGYPHGDSFGGIDYAAAADSQDEIYTFGTA